jgi:hypothetical protein
MATVFSPATAAVDVALLRNLHRIRNLMFHGGEDHIDRSSSVQCQELLRRYLGLVAAAELAEV